MTEAEWLASEDPAAMLRHVVGDGTHPRGGRLDAGTARRLRLFCCACYGVRGHVLKGIADRTYADGGAAITDPAHLALGWADGEANLGALTQRLKAGLLRDIFGNPFRPVTLEKCPRCDGDGKAHGSDRPFEWGGPGTYPGLCPVCKGFRFVRPPWLTPAVVSLASAAYDERGGEECGKCRGNRQLFRCRMCRGLWPTRQTEGLCVGCLHKGERVKLDPPTPCPDCGGAGRVATAGHLDPVRLAVLADALQEAGCCDAALLGHLRSPGPHVRGCVAVDLILGKT